MQEEVTYGDEQAPKRSRVRSVLRWIPLALILLAAALFAVAMASGGMAKITAWYLLQLVLPSLGGVALLVVLIYALWRRHFSKAMFITLMAAVLALAPLLWMFQIVQLAYPASIDTTTPSATIRLPANEPLKVIWGGDSVEVNGAHATTPDQRWAYDLVVEPYLSGSENLDDYGCYGISIVAPVSGRVVMAHDGEPDAIPGQLSMNAVAPHGNHVVFELDGGYLIISHLKPGSVAVVTGQDVEEGMLIGECGNSGNTSEPHIHIHYQRQDPAVAPVNFAEGLPLYFRDHDGPAMPEGGIQVDGDEVTAIGVTVQHQEK